MQKEGVTLSASSSKLASNVKELSELELIFEAKQRLMHEGAIEADIFEEGEEGRK